MSLELNEVLTVLTIVTLLAVVIGDRVLGWLKTRGIDLSRVTETYDTTVSIHEDTQELLKRFDDGSLEKAIEALSSNIATQTELLREMVAMNQLNRAEHKLILDQVSTISKR